MSGLLRRLRRRRPATADENRSPTAGSSEPVAAPGDAPAEPGGERPVPAEDQPTQLLPATGEQTAVAPDEQTPQVADQLSATPAEQPSETDRPTATPAEQTPEAEQTSPGAEWAKTAVTPGEPAAPESQPTAFAAQRPPARDLPAGLDPGDLTTAPAASARRGKLRRRLRYLRHVRELLLRDLGGFTYEIHRTAGGTPQESHRKLTAAKTSRIAALDAEVGALEARLGEPHADPVLREAGIGGTCPECGELHASDASYCSRCGTPLDARARAKRHAAVAAAAAPVTGSHPTPEPQPASVLWAGGPRPSAPKEPAEEEERPSGATGSWLAAQPTTFDHAARPGEARAVAKADEPAAEELQAKSSDEPAAMTGEPAANTDQPAAKTDQPAAKTDQPATETDQPATETDQPATETDQPAATKSDKPVEAAAATGEPTTPTDDPTADAPAAQADEPAADAPATTVDEPGADEPATTVDEPGADEPATVADEPAADAPATTVDEPPADAPATTGDEPPTADTPAAKSEEPASTPDEPTPEEAPPAKPKRAPAGRAKKKPLTKPRDQAPADDASFEPGPNGRRDEDVPPPVTSGDPLSSRRERRP